MASVAEVRGAISEANVAMGEAAQHGGAVVEGAGELSVAAVAEQLKQIGAVLDGQATAAEGLPFDGMATKRDDAGMRYKAALDGTAGNDHVRDLFAALNEQGEQIGEGAGARMSYVEKVRAAGAGVLALAEALLSEVEPLGDTVKTKAEEAITSGTTTVNKANEYVATL